MAGIALSLGLEESYFADRYTADPLILFRIFNYPPAPSPPGTEPRWGVGRAHRLRRAHDPEAGRRRRSGGEVASRWVDAPPLPGSFVCNIGDMLDRMTGGRYRSTPHRVRNPAPRDRLSFPFFFDPNFDAEVRPIDLGAVQIVHDDRDERWDRASVHAFRGHLRRVPSRQGREGLPGTAASGPLTQWHGVAAVTRLAQWCRER